MRVIPEQIDGYHQLPQGKKLYFASDFHLGAPNPQESFQREQQIIQWLEHVSKDASAIFLVGDLFDFWFEYRSTIPKGFVRFQGKLASLVDKGIPVHIFSGNHDLWMEDYLPAELGISLHKNPIVLRVGNKSLFVGHGDGLGPGDNRYKIIKRIFSNSLARWGFQWLHPNVGVAMARYWSRKSRLADEGKEETSRGQDEMLYQFCLEMEKSQHHDFYIFGHRHLPLEMEVNENSVYLNLGEWFSQSTYVEFNGEHASIKSFSS